MVNVKEAAPESEEQKFKQKCNELKKRIVEVEQSNEISTLALSRTRTSIRRLRLEYSILLERLEAKLFSLSEDAITGEFWRDSQKPSFLDDSLSLRPGKISVTKTPKHQNSLKVTAPVIKPVRDPALPNQPASAYLLFCENEKDRIKSEAEANSSGEPVTDLSRILSEAWSALTEEERSPYVKMHEEDRDRYYNEMLIYNENKMVEPEQHIKDVETSGAADNIISSGSQDENVEIHAEEENYERREGEHNENEFSKADPHGSATVEVSASNEVVDSKRSHDGGESDVQSAETAALLELAGGQSKRQKLEGEPGT